MRNPFVALRFVLFSFLLYLNILALGFASWNISAAKSVSLSEGGAPVFVLFNAICTLIYLILALGELALAVFWSPKVILECVWIAAFGVLNLASAIDITISGFIVACRAEETMNACASSTLLVVVTWITSSILLLYLFGLIGITTMHSSTQAAVWGAAITSIPWFVEDQLRSSNVAKPKDIERQPFENPVFKNDDELSAASSTPTWTWVKASKVRASLQAISISAPFGNSVESFRPQWAKDVKPRRGVDPPFVASQKPQAARLKSCWSSTTASSTYTPPVLPPKTRSPLGRQKGDGDYELDLPSQISLPVITPSPSRPVSYGIFPEDVHDPDMPIKPCHRSEWIKANFESR